MKYIFRFILKALLIITSIFCIIAGTLGYIAWNFQFPTKDFYEVSSYYSSLSKEPFFEDMLIDREDRYFFRTHIHYVLGKYYKSNQFKNHLKD